MSRSRRDRALEAARKHAKSGEIDLALRELQAIVGDDSSDTAARIVLGDVYTQARLTGEATRAYVQAALACSEDGRLDEAIGLLRERVIPSQPASVNARLRLAEWRLHHQPGDDADVARALEGSGRGEPGCEKTRSREAPAPVTEISQVVELSLEALDELRAATPIPDQRTRVESEPSIPRLMDEAERIRVMADKRLDPRYPVLGEHLRALGVGG